MAEREFILGDMVVFSTEERQGVCGVVSRPITKNNKGHVLTLLDGHILGADVSANEVDLADNKGEGFTQLAYNLIKLGSHVIEHTLLSS
ncbi:MAG: hypothetical protein WBB69_06880 [Anaerolineales bacterium]